MAKKSSRNLAYLEDVIAGRIRPDARDLIALVHEVNPTGHGLDRKETARRYALKNRLQSMLVRRFPDDIDAVPALDAPGTITLRYRPLDLDACHTLLAELDEDARSRVQHIIDTREDDERLVVAPKKKAATPSLDDQVSSDASIADHDGVAALLAEGRAALEAYDYELARLRFEAAVDESEGELEAAQALLSLLVEQLGADDDALAIDDEFDATALADGTVRALLAIAAARRGERARALEYLERRGTTPPAEHVAEVFVHLSKNALAEGNFAQAASDLARAKELVGTHPEFAHLADAVAKARTAARGPMEAEVANLFANGNVRGAEELASKLLARFPESEVGSRVKQAIDEQKRRDHGKAQLDEARAAFGGGEDLRAVLLLRSALSMGLTADDAAWAEGRIAMVEAKERARAEETQAREALRMLNSGDTAMGLAQYAGLSVTARCKVAECFTSPMLPWLDILFPPGRSGKPDAAVAATIALHRGAELIAIDPAAAIERLSAHEKTLSGFGPADDVRKAAHVALGKQQREAAQSRVEAARRAFVDGDPLLASRLLNDVTPKHLSEGEVRSLNELRARVEEVTKHRALEAALILHQRQGEPVRALGIAQELARVTVGAEAARFAAVCTELRAETRKMFSVHIDVPAPGHEMDPEWNSLHDARIIPKIKWDTIIRDPRGGPDDLLLIVPQMRSEWIFIRVIEVATGALRSRVMLRTPSPIEFVHAAIRNRRLYILSRLGTWIAIDLDDWAVLQWSVNILRWGEASAIPEFVAELMELDFPNALIDDAAVSADGRYLWASTFYGRHNSDRTRRIVHVFEIDSLRHVRDVREQFGVRVYCRAVLGLEQPYMALVLADDDKEDEKTIFYDPRGRPVAYAAAPMGMTPPSLVACPDRKCIFGLTSDPDWPKDPENVPWGYVEMAENGSSPLHVLDGVTAVYEATAVVSHRFGMCFALFSMRSGCELVGFRQGSAGLEIVYRLPIPHRSSFAATPDGEHAALLVIHNDRHEIMMLGATPPKFDNVRASVPFLLPVLPRGSIHMSRFNCHEPQGKRAAPARAIQAELRRLGKSRYMERIRRALKKNDPDELLALQQALAWVDEPTAGGELGARIIARFPDHPRVRLSDTHTLAAIGQHQSVLQKLDGVDPAQLDDADAKHLYHMRGIAKFMLDDPEGALVEFDRCVSYEEGACDPEELMAICAPLSDIERSWDPSALVMRDWLSRVVAADAALAQGDATAARQAIDVVALWEAQELQSFGRLAVAHLQEVEQGVEGNPFRRALALATYCELYATRMTMTRREVPLPRATWSSDKLADIDRRARQWLDNFFGKHEHAGG